MIGSVPLLFLVTGFFGFGDDGAFLLGGMLLACARGTVCVRMCGRVEIEGGGGQRHCLPATDALEARTVVFFLANMSSSLL